MILIGGFILFVHGHELMGNKTVQSSVVFDTGQIAVVLNSNKRVFSKRLKSKRSRRRTKSFRVEDRIISLEQLLNDVQNCRFTSSSSAIKNHKFLYLLGIASYDSTDGPLDFMTLFRRIESGYELFVGWRIAGFEGVGQAFTRIVFLFGRVV